MPRKRLVKVYAADDLRYSGTQKASTVVYAPPGTAVKKRDIGRIRRIVQALGAAAKGWEIESVSIGMPPLVVKVRPKKK